MLSMSLKNVQFLVQVLEAPKLPGALYDFPFIYRYGHLYGPSEQPTECPKRQEAMRVKLHIMHFCIYFLFFLNICSSLLSFC